MENGVERGCLSGMIAEEWSVVLVLEVLTYASLYSSMLLLAPSSRDLVRYMCAETIVTC